MRLNQKQLFKRWSISMTIVTGYYYSLLKVNQDIKTFKLPYKSQYNTPIFSSRVGIMLVKIDDTATATEYGVEDTPALVYFENEVPHLYEGKKDIS